MKRDALILAQAGRILRMPVVPTFNMKEYG
jgi:hypothetical protein